MKIKNNFAVLTASVVLLISPYAAFADSGIVRNAINGHWYQRFDASMSWYQAKAFCEKRGGYLATITSQIENDFVWSNLASKSPNTGGTWLGATNDKTNGGAYQWITGEKWNYSNWNAGTHEPNNAAVFPGGSEHYAEYFPTVTFANEPVIAGSWNDISVYNIGTLWSVGQDSITNNVRPVSTICEWGGYSSVNF